MIFRSMVNMRKKNLTLLSRLERCEVVLEDFERLFNGVSKRFFLNLFLVYEFKDFVEM